jgi:hypothetical protein
VTEHDRISREQLLRRAAAVAGSVYLAPALTSSARATAGACSGQPCKRNRKCARLGGKTCKCSQGRCRPPDTCRPDDRCGPQVPCQEFRACGDPGVGCGCFVLANSGGKTECAYLNPNICSDFNPCDKRTGEGCPPYECCFDTCCPRGICLTTSRCGSAATTN